VDPSPLGQVIADPPDDGVLRLRAIGEFDRNNQADLDAVIRSAVTAGHHAVTIDVAAVTFLDVSGVRTLLCALQLAADHGCTFRVLNASGIAARIFDVTDTSRLLCGTGPAPSP
jgi:anti-anti-sigma factor